MATNSILRYFLYIIAFIAIAGVAALFTMEFLTKGKTVAVPDLREKEIVKAGGLLQNAGLTLRIQGEEFHPVIPKDFIISQKPEPNSIIKEGRSVGVIVSKGLQEVIIPKLEMEPLRRAEIIIRQNGLTVGNVARVNSATADRDSIISQTPPSGSVADRRRNVDLLVSSGPEDTWYKTPDLSGKTLEEGSAVLEKMGIGIKMVLAKGNETGLIIGQKPKPGFPIKKGDKLELTVSEK